MMRVVFDKSVVYLGVKYTPGEEIEVYEKDIESLKGDGARIVEGPPSITPKNPQVVPVDVVSQEPVVNNEEPKKDITLMTRKALLAYAKENGFAVSESMSKKELLDILG